MAVFSNEYLERVAAGKVRGNSIIYKFGQADLTSTFSPVSHDLTYPTPISAVELEVVSTNSGDNVAGLGARTITVTGLDSNCNFISEDINLNGTTPVVLTNNFLRVWRVAVKESGTYATQFASSQLGDIILRESGGGTVWGSCRIFGGIGLGSSLIGCISIPDKHTAHIIKTETSLDSTKSVDICMFTRCNINNVTAPFDPMLLTEIHKASTESLVKYPKSFGKEYVGPCDIGYLARASSGGGGSGTLSISFDVLLIDQRVN